MVEMRDGSRVVASLRLLAEECEMNAPDNETMFEMLRRSTVAAGLAALAQAIQELGRNEQ